MKNLAHIGSLAFAFLVVASGCGAAGNPELPAATTGAAQVPGAITPATDTGQPYDPNLAAPYTFTFRIAGSTSPPSGSSRPASISQTITNIQTDNRLLVTVSGGDPVAVPNTGYTAAFSCLRVDVTVLGQTQTAYVTNTGAAGTGACQGAVARQTLNFSSRLTANHAPPTIQISNAMYDNCRVYSGNPYAYGCPVTAVYWNHIVQGKLDVHVNGTN